MDEAGPADRARPAALGARHAVDDRDGHADADAGTRRDHRLGRGGQGGRGSHGRRRGRRPGRRDLDDRRHEPRAADLVLDRGRRDRHPGPRRVGPRPARREAGQAGQPGGPGGGPQAGRRNGRRHGQQPRRSNAQGRRHEGRDRQRGRGPPGGRGGVAGRGRRQGQAAEADVGGRRGVRPRMKMISDYSVYLLGDRQQPLGREHRGSGHGDQRHGRAGWRQVRLLEGRRRPARRPRHGPRQRDREREDHRHRRVRRRHLHHVHDAVQRGVPGRHDPARRARTTASTSPAIRRASTPPCGSSARPSRR